jgi:ribosome-associated protein
MEPEEEARVLRVSAGLSVPLSELQWRFGPSGGPGGQHANRAHTRAEVEFDIAGSPSLDERTRRRLLERVGPVARAGADGERSQARNRTQALDRLRSLLADAAREPKHRRPTRPSRSSVQRRLDAKRRQADRKRGRRARPEDW